MAFAGLRIRHAAVAVVYLALPAMPLGGFARMIMTIVFHGGSVQSLD
jgi:hypothetical protein